MTIHTRSSTDPNTAEPTESKALALFFEKVKTIGFFERVFQWKPFRTLSFDAYDQYQLLVRDRQSYDRALKQQQDAYQQSQKEVEAHQQKAQHHATEMIELKGKLEQKQSHLEERNIDIARLEENQKQWHDKWAFEKQEHAIAKEKEATQLKAIEKLEKELSNLKVIVHKDEASLRDKGIELGALTGQVEQLQTVMRAKEKEVGQATTTAEKNQGRVHELENEKALFRQQLILLQQQLNHSNEKLVQHEERIEAQQQAFDHRVTQLNALKGQLDEEKERVRLEREAELQQRLEAMKLVWQTHEAEVEARIHDICNRHHIEWVDREKIPFKGKPDNTLKIANEYLIFDAKAPLSEDLKAFGTYIRNSAEQLKKYASQDAVKKDLFLVIPNNVSTHIKESFLNLVDYRVFVVTLDALEPIILSLLKIELYEFAEQLSPEERENIARVIGKFAHAAKRKIQVDSYLNSHFLSILEQCDQLPEGLLEEAKVYEKSDKLNPPMERRVKAISMKETQKSVKKLNANAHAENIPVGALLATTLDQIPVEISE